MTDEQRDRLDDALLELEPPDKEREYEREYEEEAYSLIWR